MTAKHFLIGWQQIVSCEASSGTQWHGTVRRMSTSERTSRANVCRGSEGQDSLQNDPEAPPRVGAAPHEALPDRARPPAETEHPVLSGAAKFAAAAEAGEQWCGGTPSGGSTRSPPGSAPDATVADAPVQKLLSCQSSDIHHPNTR